MKDHIVRLVATGLYSGYGRPFPGTWGTGPAWLIGYFLIAGDQRLLIGAVVVSTVLSVWAAGEAEKMFGHDARKIVIDEWAGMFVTFLLVPFSFQNYMIAFVMFRVFDVVKIPPARNAEKLPGGWGVTLDDIVAGVQACVATHLIIYGIDMYMKS